MGEREVFDRILASLHEAALDDARWPAASALIDEACRAKGNALVFGDGRSREDVRIFFEGFYFRGQRHRELEREYFDVYHPLDERLPRLRRLPDGRLVHVAELYTDDEVKSRQQPCQDELARGELRGDVAVAAPRLHEARLVEQPFVAGADEVVHLERREPPASVVQPDERHRACAASGFGVPPDQFYHRV